MPRARNEICATFLASECTDLIFIDDDMGWKPDAILRLLASEHQVVGGAYRTRLDGGAWCISLLSGGSSLLPGDIEQDASGSGAIEVAGIGTGMMKIERSVLERMAAAHPEWKRDGHSSMSEAVRSHYYQFFRFDADDGAEIGEDYVFCRRWRDLGGTIWIDPQIELAHVGLKAWRGCIADTLAGDLK